MSLKGQVVSGLKWSVAAKAVTQIFSWVSTFLVIRMLTPEDYGLVAIATVFFSFISLFTTNGLILSLVRKQEVDPRSNNQIFTFALLLNSALSVAMIVGASYIAGWYEKPELYDVIFVLALLNPISSFSVIPTAHLQIQMKFKEKAIVDGFAGFVGAIVAFSSAYMGSEYWALIHANIAMMVSQVVCMNLAAKKTFRPTLDWSGGRDIIGYAVYVQLGQVVWFSYNNADTILVGRLLGVDKLGVYNVAKEIASIPMSKINGVMNEVAFSAFAKTNKDIEQAKVYLTKAIRLMGCLVFPIFFGISAVASEAMLVVLGEKWALAGPLVAILCLVLPFRMINTVTNNFSSGMGYAKFGFINGTVMAVIMIISITIGASISLYMTAVAWALGFLVSYAFVIIRLKLKFSLPFSTLFAYWPSLVISSLMWVFIFFVQNNIVEQYGLFNVIAENVFFLLMTKILLGALFAGPLLIYVYGKELKALLGK